jgi:thymidylate kinase
MSAHIVFVTGVNGVGKTTVIPHLQELLPKADVRDFDERGVPTSADREWRESETVHWLDVGRTNSAKNVTTIICGYAKPKEIHEFAERMEIPVSVCVLVADAEALTARIAARYVTPEDLEELQRTTGKTVEKFTEDNIYISGQFANDAREFDYALLETSKKTPKETAAAIAEWLADLD